VGHASLKEGRALDGLLGALAQVYPDAATLADPRTAHFVVDDNHLVSRHVVPGVTLEVSEQGERLVADLVVAQGTRVEAPIHSCIGFLGRHGAQQIALRLRLEPGADAALIAHCLFPGAEAGSHVMEAEIDVGAGAELRYNEGHYHGRSGGMSVRPRLQVRLGAGARYRSDFSLTQGTVGTLALEQRIEAGENAVAEISARIFGRASDAIRIRDELVLAGRGSRGRIKTRIALCGDARADVVGVTRGRAEGVRGHMDCLELVRERAVARAEPIIEVSHPLAKVTHEAAVGTVDQNQLETLMAHGLSPDEAVDLIVTGILR